MPSMAQKDSPVMVKERINPVLYYSTIQGSQHLLQKPGLPVVEGVPSAEHSLWSAHRAVAITISAIDGHFTC